MARIAQNESFDVERFDGMGNVKTADEAENIGKVIGKYLKKYGINLNFAPVADVDSNPDNPVIGVRAFSCDPDTVSEMVSRQIDGYHSSGIITSIKHFPGHGDTDSDTHTGYVSLDKPWSELKKVELVPFKNNLDKTDTVMVSHITLPQAAYGGLPASLSYEIVTGKLRDELGFDGVIVTDAMEMGAISDTYGGESAVMAIKAGCDIVLMPHDLESAFGAVISAVEKGEISQERVNESVLRVLGLKEKYGII